MAKLIHPDLSYKIVGILYDSYNKLGYGYQEKYYQNAIETLLNKEKISYDKELYCPIYISDKRVGFYKLDFFVDNKIILELKVAQDFYKQHIIQVLSYLKHKNIDLGILAIYTKKGLRYKRITK